MNNNIKIAKQLIALAKELIAVPTATFNDFNQFNNDYKNTHGKNVDSSIWDLFTTQAQVDAFLKAKSQAHPNLSEFIDKGTLEKILKKGYFTICSAGISSAEYSALLKKYTNDDGVLDEQGFEKEKNSLVKSRLDEFCKFLDSLDVKYYEVLGQFYDEGSKTELAELSYIVDLTNIGENSDAEAKQIMKKISNYCGNNMNQTAVIEGIKGLGAYVFCGDRSHLPKRGEGDMGYGRSTVRHDQRNRTDWSDDYGFGDEPPVQPSKKDWI